MAQVISNRRERLFSTTLLVAGVAIIVSVAINIVVDPYGTYRLVNVKGLNVVKPYPDHDLETIKTHALRHVQPDALILGNSRAEVGIDPLHSLWGKSGYSSVYNAAIAGAGTGTAWKLLEVAARSHAPKFILLGIDFFDFPIAPASIANQPEGSNSQALDDVRWMLRSSLTMKALLDSASTVFRQYQVHPSQLTLLGHNPLLEYQEIVREEGYWTLFRQRAEENAKIHGRKPHNLYLADTKSSPSFENIRRIIRWSIDHDSELHLIIYPYHAQLLLLIDDLGFTPLFGEWKRRLVQIVEDESQGQQHRVTLTDFSGLSSYTQDQIPPKGDKKSSTRWYWEAGHFKKELGDQILQKIFKVSGAAGIENFGVMLSRENIDAYLAMQQHALTTFKAMNMVMAGEVAMLAARSKQQDSPLDSLTQIPAIEHLSK